MQLARVRARLHVCARVCMRVWRSDGERRNEGFALRAHNRRVYGRRSHGCRARIPSLPGLYNQVPHNPVPGKQIVKLAAAAGGFTDLARTGARESTLGASLFSRDRRACVRGDELQRSFHYRIYVRRMSYAISDWLVFFCCRTFWSMFMGEALARFFVCVLLIMRLDRQFWNLITHRCINNLDTSFDNYGNGQ